MSPARAKAEEQAGDGKDPPAPRGQSEAVRLIAELRQLSEGSAEWRRLRDRLVEMHLPLVEYLARRFSGRSEPMNDLTQVGAIGLIKAIDRFDVTRGLEFSTYATPTILGEIKRHFRDTGWLIHVPRRAQELQTTLTTARAELSQELRRSPTVAELAERTGVPADQIVEALDAARAYAGVPIDVLTDPDTGHVEHPALSEYDERFDQVEQRALLRPIIQSLPEREQRILLLRFVAGRSQTEIAAIAGVSQMQVSRLVARSLATLRAELAGADESVTP
jgi:RNA polymerase sigma-B factor